MSKTSAKTKEFKKGYEKGMQLRDGGDSQRHLLRSDRDDTELLRESKKIIGNKEYSQNSSPEDKGYALGIARGLITTKKGRAQHVHHYALKGAQIYEQLGMGGNPSVKRGLQKASKKDIQELGQDDANRYGEGRRVEDFLERNPSQKGIEDRVIPVLASLGLIVSIFFLSPNITGNAVEDMAQNTSDWIGGILFVLGLIGFYFWKKY
ncbi:hypothetical protein GOV13_01965 [Candidatus Pacearchaeota archaeon]|nr:hypothetical protein [Candidatus Pacearchaeota archaeon]